MSSIAGQEGLRRADPTPLWDLGRIPFQIGARERPSNAPFPDRLPFVVGVDDLGTVVQVPDAEVVRHLAEVYRRGYQIGTPMDDQGLGKRYGEDFHDFVLAHLPGSRPAGLDVLEVGCGAGYLLKKLASEGARVTGVEPDRRSAAVAQREGLRVLAEEFDARHLEPGYDLILHYAVLEHIQDPLPFMRDLVGLLRDGGVLAFSVPDETPNILRGDLQMLYHQHWNYFSRDSLRALAARAGARVIDAQPAGVGEPVYSAWTRGEADRPAAAPTGSAAGYRARAQDNLGRLREYVARIRDAGESLGVYCPSRALTYLAMLERDAGVMRFFDDDARISGRYHPPFDIPIETRASLCARPTDHVLIMSRSFGPAIAEGLRAAGLPRRTRVVQVADLLP